MKCICCLRSHKFCSINGEDHSVKWVSHHLDKEVCINQGAGIKLKEDGQFNGNILTFICLRASNFFGMRGVTLWCNTLPPSDWIPNCHLHNLAKMQGCRAVKENRNSLLEFSDYPYLCSFSILNMLHLHFQPMSCLPSRTEKCKRLVHLDTFSLLLFTFTSKLTYTKVFSYTSCLQEPSCQH